MIRRIALLAALMTAFCAPAHTEPVWVIQLDGAAALVDARGDVRIGGVPQVFEVRKHVLYAAGEEGCYRLYDAGGDVVGGGEFAMIADAGDALIFRRDGLFGAMDAEGGTVVAPEWTQLVDCGGESFLALATDPLDDQPDEVIRVIPGAEAAQTGIYTAVGLRAFREGRMPYAAANGAWGYLDGAGVAAIPPQWRYAGDFDHGTAVVASDSGYGLIDAEGAMLIEPVYAWMSRSVAVVAALTKDGALEVYSADGAEVRFIIEPQVVQAELVGGCVAVVTDDAARLYDADGSCLYEAQADALFFEGVDGQTIVSDGRWGEACQRLIDPDGKESAARFQRILPLIPDRYAFIEMSGVEYYSRDLESLQTSWDYGSVRYGLMDGGGRVLLPAEHLGIRALGDDRLLLVDEDAVTFADGNGVAIRVWPTAEGETASFGAGT